MAIREYFPRLYDHLPIFITNLMYASKLPEGYLEKPAEA